jgi:hypothetical protein
MRNVSISRFVNSQTESARPTRVAVVSVLAASLAAVLMGPFGTGALPLSSRILFWVTLIGWNSWKWRFWHRIVPPLLPDTGWARLCFAIAGAVLLNTLLPFEIAFLFSAVGHPQPLPYLGVFLTAVALSLSISAIIAVVMDMQASPAPVVEVPATPMPATPALPPSGLAARIDLAGLHAIVAEDHYLRLHFANGRQPLVLYRFGDAVRELAGVDGQQVHRGAWVAAAARPQALRDGRKWRLQLENGTMIAISDTYLPLVRRRGWLGQ